MWHFYFDLANSIAQRDNMTPSTNDPEIKYIRLGDTSLAYREANSGQSKTLVLLHGLAESSAFFWRPLFKDFSTSYRIIAFDLLGHGQSDSDVEDYSPFHQASLIYSALQNLGIERVTIIAHSLGGMVGLAYTLTYPKDVEKLLLYSVPIGKGFWRTVPELLSEVSILSLLPSFPLIVPFSGRAMKLSPQFLQKVAFSLIFRQWGVPFAISDTNFAQFQHEMIGEAIKTTGIGLEKTVRDTFLFCNIYDRLTEIDIPVLFIKGHTDFILSDRMQYRYTSKVRNSQSIILKETSHISLLDDPTNFLKHLKAFLEM